MGTVDKRMADVVIRNDGLYPGDLERIVRIVKYENSWGSDSYGLEYMRELGRFQSSRYVNDPAVYWKHSSCPEQFHTI